MSTISGVSRLLGNPWCSLFWVMILAVGNWDDRQGFGKSKGTKPIILTASHAQYKTKAGANYLSCPQRVKRGGLQGTVGDGGDQAAFGTVCVLLAAVRFFFLFIPLLFLVFSFFA